MLAPRRRLMLLIGGGGWGYGEVWRKLAQVFENRADGWMNCCWILIDDVMWFVHGQSVREVRAKLEGAARRAVEWGRTNGVRFEPGKTEVILFSRNRRHWRDRTHEKIKVGSHQIAFNVKATRWLGIYLDSRLGFSEHSKKRPSS